MKNFSKLCCLLSVNMLSADPQVNAQKKIETHPTAIFVDFDNVLTSAYKPKMSDAPLMGSLLIAHPQGTIKGLWNIEKLKAKGIEFSKQPNATMNTTIDQMILYLKQEGFGDFSGSRDTILTLATQPEPIDAMIELLWQLKKEGHVLIGATNQPYNQNVIYRKKLKEKGINLNQLFDTILTTHAELDNKNNQSTSSGYAVYMAHKEIKKPDSQYYEILKELALKHKINCAQQNCFFIDDLEENIEGANNTGLLGLHFHKLSKKQSAKQSTQKIKEELLKQKIRT